MQVNLNLKPCILLVDDVPANLRTLTDLLSSSYTLKLATSGIQALHILKSKPLPDIILLDVMMPDMDGYAVCRELKRWVTTQHIPVIFLTALDEDNDEMLGLEVGADDYITKPFKPEIVLARIRNQLRRSVTAAPANLQYDPFKTNSFTKNGLTWHISFQGNPTFHLPERQGLDYLKVLLTHPGQELTVEELAFLVLPKERSRLLDLAGARISAQRAKLLEAYAENAYAMIGLNNQRKPDAASGVTPKKLFEMLRIERVLENDPLLAAVDRERYRKSISIALRRSIDDISLFDPFFANHLKAPTLRMGFKLIYAPNPEISWLA